MDAPYDKTYVQFETALASEIDGIVARIRSEGLSDLQANEFSLAKKDDFEAVYPHEGTPEEQERAAGLLYEVLGILDMSPDDESAIAELKTIRGQLA